MGRVSNVLITIVNVITLVLALTVIGLSIWFEMHKSSSLCHKVLQKPLLYLGFAIFLVSICGLVGSCSKRFSFILWVYLMLLFLLILGMIAFSVFAVMVTSRGVGKAVSNRGLADHKLGDYSRWLQKYVLNDENWSQIKSCMVGVGFCKHFSGVKNGDFFDKGISATQSGCCKPPSYCGLEFRNVTYWTMPKSGPAVPDSDCTTWNNDQTQLCFDCKSCKAAFLDNIKREWRTLALINVIILLVIIIVYSIGCCALRNNQDGGLEKYRAGYL